MPFKNLLRLTSFYCRHWYFAFKFVVIVQSANILKHNWCLSLEFLGLISREVLKHLVSDNDPHLLRELRASQK